MGDQILTLIRNHPERLDGTGYPDKLKFGELPLPLRILCVADAFDAMSSYRPWRQQMDGKARREQLNRFAGTQFDPVVIETLKGLLSEQSVEQLYEEHWQKHSERKLAEAQSKKEQSELFTETNPVHLADLEVMDALKEIAENAMGDDGEQLAAFDKAA